MQKSIIFYKLQITHRNIIRKHHEMVHFFYIRV